MAALASGTLVREGDELLVQVVKDPIGTKGARLSTHVSLPSRFLVYLPRGSKVGVSSRIESEAERARLRKSSVLDYVLVGELGPTYGERGVNSSLYSAILDQSLSADLGELALEPIAP